MGREHEFVVIGSGAGGASVARELAVAGKDVLVVERGSRAKRLGTMQAVLDMYDGNRVLRRPLHSREGVILWRTFVLGGSTVVATGNGVRCLEAELTERGVPIDKELGEVEEELEVSPWPLDRLSEGGRRLVAAAAESHRDFAPMPKFIDPSECGRCGLCAWGCQRDAKWSAARFIDDAVQSGAHVVEECRAMGVTSSGGRVTGVVVQPARGKKYTVAARTVIVAAGGLSTPVILAQAGIEARDGLFADLFVNVYATTSTTSQLDEPLMALVDLSRHHDEGFLLSSYVGHTRAQRLSEAGVKGARLPSNRTLGVMVKTRDDPAGRVLGEGSISKPVTSDDRIRIDRGAAAAREILLRAGGDPSSVCMSVVQGAHAGGTAAVGKVVDSDLQTRLHGLFVCDASVLPAAPGLPPILTIVALGKRLGRALAA
jgi:choline dehydrogenase-like flavoprotein